MADFFPKWKNHLEEMGFIYAEESKGFAAVIPFLPVVAKQLGVNATALGIVFSVIPIFTFLCNPLIGILVDYFQNIKAFLIVLLIASTISYAGILWLPPISYDNTDAMYVRVSSLNETKVFINVSKPFERSCLEKILQNYTECKLTFQNEKEHTNDTSNSDSTLNVTYNADQIKNNNKTKGRKLWITFYIKDVFLFERQDIANPINIQCSPSIHNCSTDNKSPDIFSAYQLWMFFILVIFSAVTATSANSLTSVACFEILGKNPEAYGRQMLFGAIAWGIVCPLSGWLSDLDVDGHFLSVTFLMAIFRTIDIIILCVMFLPKAHISSNMSRDLRIIFTSSKEILLFSLGVTIIGFLAELIFVFEFWFLEDMGASRTLLGLSILMQCIVGEVPFLFFSGWFVNKLGHFLCLTCVYFGFFARLLFYFHLRNPWLVLPVDTLHGLTFGLFHVTMTSYAKENAPKGMEATLLGLFGGLYEGLGYGTGSILGGFGLDKIGPRQTFFYASMLSLGCFVLFVLASYTFRRPPNCQPSKFASFEIEERPLLLDSLSSSVNEA